MANYLETLLKHASPVRGEVFGGSIKLTRSMAAKLRPFQASMEKCAGSLVVPDKSASPCKEVVTMATIMDRQQITFHQVDEGRQALCRMMRACPVANHATPEQRKSLPCGKVQTIFDQKLGKT